VVGVVIDVKEVELEVVVPAELVVGVCEVVDGVEEVII